MAHSSCEIKVYTIEKYAKSLQYVGHIIINLNLKSTLNPSTFSVLNKNHAFVNWSSNMLTKGLHPIQICTHAIRESGQSGSVVTNHITGKINLSGIFTKGDKDKHHFLSIWVELMSLPPGLMPDSPVSSIHYHRATIHLPPKYISALFGHPIFPICYSPSWPEGCVGLYRL
eukprot:1393110-Ditylum_brightwellii.AAC.1